MTIINKFFCSSIILLVFACGKDEIIDNQIINATNTFEVIKEKSTDLKIGFTFKKETIEAKKLDTKESLIPRYNHSSLVFNNKMWILGGNVPDASNDVLFSIDGANWKTITEQTNFPHRFQFGATVFQNKMWVAGGSGKINPENIANINNDVWSSTDGIEWKLVTPKAQFLGRFDHTLTAFKGFLWLIGGVGFNEKANTYETLSDIWKSSDGINWVNVTDSSPFGPRRWHAAVVHDDKIWVVGGGNINYNNDVWYSENGYQWTLATDNAAFSKRGLHDLTTDGKLMWLTSGHAEQYKDDNYNHQNDIWYSSNGVNWHKAFTSQEFPKRTQHTSVFFDDKLWLINGTGPNNDSGTNPFLSDVWSFEK